MRSKLSLLVASLLTIPLISAASWGGLGGYGSPFDYFNNEWVKFTIVLVVVSLLIYYFVDKKTNNTPVSLIVGFGLGLLITIALTKRGILDNFLEETIVDWILIIAVLCVIFFLFYKLAFREDMYGSRRFSLWRFIFTLVLITLIPLFIDLEEILPEALMYGPFLDFIELLQGFSSVIFIGLGVVIIIWILWKIKNLFSGRRRRYSRGWGRRNQVQEFSRRAKRASARDINRYSGRRGRRPSWRERRRGRRSQEGHRSFRQATNRTDWARKEHGRQQEIARKWKSRAIIVQKRDAEKQAARQAREQAQRQAEQERAQRILEAKKAEAQAKNLEGKRRWYNRRAKKNLPNQPKIKREEIRQKNLAKETQARAKAEAEEKVGKARRLTEEQAKRHIASEQKRQENLAKEAQARTNAEAQEKIRRERIWMRKRAEEARLKAIKKQEIDEKIRKERIWMRKRTESTQKKIKIEKEKGWIQRRAEASSGSRENLAKELKAKQQRKNRGRVEREGKERARKEARERFLKEQAQVKARDEAEARAKTEKEAPQQKEIAQLQRRINARKGQMTKTLNLIKVGQTAEGGPNKKFIEQNQKRYEEAKRQMEFLLKKQDRIKRMLR